MNLTLIGMPGSGKSLLGRLAAERLGLAFVETDRLMERACGRPLQEVLESLGKDAFLALEAGTLMERTSDRDGMLVSPGGSIVYHTGAMAHLKRISTIVYLQVPLTVIEQRIGLVPRGIVGLGAKTLADLHAERAPLYERWADATVDADQDVQTALSRVLDVATVRRPHLS